jgi:hypothetical protein
VRRETAAPEFRKATFQASMALNVAFLNFRGGAA